MQVRKLLPCEDVGLMVERLEKIWLTLGPEHGEVALSAAMEDLAVLLCECNDAWTEGDPARLRLHALGLQGVAKRLGMQLLVRVAGDVIALCCMCDVAALAATVARLQRVGEQSLVAIWDAQVPAG
ncbi:hypothetical protein [Pseudoruegeria sp. HB172150]|uniref:hypothetical protein n=1 Tax=Pseudoruegeria sp. HB172150 TaxID=2721164 RepID=UPI001551F1F8|nr:hypothetical protein [Pseudoruegeria sp. HB172150]